MDNLILTQLTQQEMKKLIKESIREILFEEKEKNGGKSTPDFMTIEQAAAFLQMSVQTIYGYTSRKVIPFIKRGKQLRFLRADLENWLVGGKNKSVSEMKQEIRETGTLKF
jgi:excisionase family DNA binding protein